MVKHIVSFRLKGTDAERRKAAEDFRDALMALPAQIEVLRSMEVGLNENPAEDWDVVLIAEVDKMEDVAVYAAHPAHVAAASIISGCKEARACVDYEV
ncbi:MAG: Dabb family protein [Bacteroidales bacterium]|nr:Dabb family protein [Bacteroidales bacterium]MBD5212874.1 Dabb family protein [Bacteroidales bacterium]MBD5221301.1 Dabb family protein [Bacteroidales bacterium]